MIYKDVPNRNSGGKKSKLSNSKCVTVLIITNKMHLRTDAYASVATSNFWKDTGETANSGYL